MTDEHPDLRQVATEFCNPLLLGFDFLPGCGCKSYGAGPEIGNAVRFCLSAYRNSDCPVTFVAKEDPEDGYRSCCSELHRREGNLCDNRFECEATMVHLSAQNGDKCNLLEIRDCHTDKPVLVVGTDNIDDYYPAFVADFTPENMQVNQPEPKPEEPKATHIAGNYEPLFDCVLLAPVAVTEGAEESRLVKLVVTDEEKRWSRTRWRVEAVGPDVQELAPGDLVLLSGRATKVIAKEMLAEYVTAFAIGDEVRIIVPESEIRARVS